MKQLIPCLKTISDRWKAISETSLNTGKQSGTLSMSKYISRVKKDPTKMRDLIEEEILNLKKVLSEDKGRTY